MPTEPDGGADTSNAEMERFHLITDRNAEKLVEAQEAALEKTKEFKVVDTTQETEATQRLDCSDETMFTELKEIAAKSKKRKERKA